MTLTLYNLLGGRCRSGRPHRRWPISRGHWPRPSARPLTSWVIATLALAAPLALGGGLKVLYDLLIYFTFRDVPLREEASRP